MRWRKRGRKSVLQSFLFWFAYYTHFFFSRCLCRRRCRRRILRTLLTTTGRQHDNLRKPPTFPAKWRLRNKRRNSTLMTCLYSYLGLSCLEGNLLQPIRSTNQIWVVTRHQYGIFAFIPQTSFHLVANSRLFSQVRSISELTVTHLTLNMRGVK